MPTPLGLWLYCLWDALRRRDWYMLRFEGRCGLGHLLCLCRCPGFAAPGEYRAPTGLRVRVEVTYGSTIVTVDRTRLVFDRLTGRAESVEAF